MSNSAGQTTGPRRPVAEAVAEAEAHSTTAARLAELGQHPSASVRAAVADNTACDDATVLLLASEAKASVRLSAACNAAGRPGVEAELAASDDTSVRSILAHTYARQRRQLLRPTQEVLARDADREVRARIAETTAHRDLFDQLLEDPEPRVRAMCAANPRASRADVDRLLADRKAATRCIAINVGIAFPDAEQLVRAAGDRSAEVRWAALFKHGAPREVALALVDDADDDLRHHARLAARDREQVWAPRGEAQAVAEDADLVEAGWTFEGASSS